MVADTRKGAFGPTSVIPVTGYIRSRDTGLGRMCNRSRLKGRRPGKRFKSKAELPEERAWASSTPAGKARTMTWVFFSGSKYDSPV
jgi:hypothetical protein